MFKDIHFIKSVFELSGLSKVTLPQLILCGRSNVGKSSFINSISNRKGLAKTSSTPGKTRSINFYKANDTFFIVDLPGFGYAKTSQTEREKWGNLVSRYILDSKNIHHAFHLIDSRYEPTDLDKELNAWLKSAEKDYSVILSKADKLNQSENYKAVKLIVSVFPELVLNKNLFLYSSVTGKWKKPVQKKITELFF
ncbi:MAG: YihA family ribosome biogenesis GTP-binding protein [Ignavibacteriota bacterium]|nr:MAG: YihA family ribosome biogenesis GTP-binding protein [Chlorobiota bacterium]MBE7476975.1 YihA family ribosome biogenesis GTP-binding protein [Ignavibacteriales bacterium]MBL1121775.1 YihA family ribosome biogenesis GTP-binding protein [Ignavibacteriota bacterium]MCC7093347.1 YihA family ribosome biogenesis GTP-binding protein [Ignavibacteriaceae bacterium]MCE7855335.1 YihA family ribosome biogenesis GTP-binding protein [Ignavibacteria bacterium CHB3]MEB2295630.1 ribosome biogenesis GTP-